ncbi:uncharacterized protein LOC131668928 [Phymastichus coffea]|uniref:uncharacterized protein LOC131668928 n=1 Tax=Phymastichus coffea TaxID=108790 RepID=UPI00273B0746|nr:uncharacterized protein LOC131668928 [Phymastichus coffea]
MQIFISNGARVCKEHILNDRFYEDDSARIKITSKCSQIPVDEVTRLIEGLTVESNKSLLHEAGAFHLSENRLKTLTGLTSENIKQLSSMMKSLNNSQNRTKVEGLITFLFKLQSGASNSNIATIFKFDREQLVSDICSDVIRAFETDILPLNFDARKLLNLKHDQLALIFDGTYLKHQKSFNNEFQRNSYSGQKKMPLVKPFTVTTTIGYIVDTCGPYEGTKNNAHIMKKVMVDPHSMFQFMKKGDIIIVDRGFRDVVSLLEEKEFIVIMPALKGKRKQLPTKETNESRFVTKLRWVIEGTHGQLKQKHKLLHHQLDNKLLLKAKSLNRIACYLNNEFGKRFKTDDSLSDEIISRMLSHRNTENTLAKEVEEAKWSRRATSFQKFNANDLDDFPEITKRSLKILFSGTYQLAMAISYLAEILDEKNELELKYVKAYKNIIAVSVQSCHIKSKIYKCYIDYKPKTQGLSGCCCHVAAIIYYLSCARYQSRIFRPAEKLTTLFREEGVDLDEAINEENASHSETISTVGESAQREMGEKEETSDSEEDNDRD